MVHLRLIVPLHLVAVIVEGLRTRPGVAHLVRVEPAETEKPSGQLILCDVAREAANEVVEWLQGHAIHHEGAITVVTLEAVISDAAERASERAPGHASDALIWEELEGRARAEGVVTASFLVFIAIAAVIAVVGILLDAPILIVGAMVVGPEYGPVAALCVALVRTRFRSAASAGATLAAGMITASVSAFVATVAFRVTRLGPDVYDLSDRQLTAFISHPDGMAAVVAVLAGVIGMLSLTEGRSGALVGVLVSVTTIPAVANIGVATAYQEWTEVVGATTQLAVNLAGLVVAGITTLAVQVRSTRGQAALRTSGTRRGDGNGPPSARRA